MNRYNFVRVSRPETTAKEADAAQTITSVADLLSINKAIGEFVFTADAELSKAFSEAQSVTTRIETLSSGSEVNRVDVVLKDGSKYVCRAFGTGRGNILPGKQWSTKEIKGITAGFCKSDNELVTDLRNDGNGGVIKAPVFYVKIA